MASWTYSARSGEVYTLSSTLSHVTVEEPHAHALEVLWRDLQNSEFPMRMQGRMLTGRIICLKSIVGVRLMFPCHLSTDCGLQRLDQLGCDYDEVVMVGL